MLEGIVLSGFARVGKDEVAKILVEQYGFQRRAFADKLREVLFALNPVVGWKWDTGGESDRPQLWRLQDHFKYDKQGWDTYKESNYANEIRRLLQRLGTEAGRQTLWDSIWIDAALTNLSEDARVVVTDGRFYNEFDSIRERGGEVWRVERPGVGPLNDHASETEAILYPHFDRVIVNDGTLEDLAEKVRIAYLGD